MYIQVMIYCTERRTVEPTKTEIKMDNEAASNASTDTFAYI